MRILVVDDDPPSVKMIAFLLQEEGYSVLTADNGRTALELIKNEKPDLVILDVMMPHVDGLEVCRRLRSQMVDVSIIILSAKGETSDRVQGLDLGADDYLVKPFEPSELLARVKAVLRRSDSYLLNGAAQGRLSVGGITLDPLTNEAILESGQTISLTPIEFRLLHCLMRNAGHTLTHDTLLGTVWGYDYEGDSNPLAVYIRRLRSKIEPEPDKPSRLVTVRGLGYRFEAD
ncbi:MAG: response regulator transcription factor [Chloroflexi bacterium]|nr:response regulator transcription factor [Chloroflexota bacterium]